MGLYGRDAITPAVAKDTKTVAKNVRNLQRTPSLCPKPSCMTKKRIFQNANLTIVTPSRWMGRCARESRLFKPLRVEVIANSLETDLYSPLAKEQARERLEIPD